MSKDSIDYSELSDTIYKKSYKLSDVKDRLEKVAFDVVRFKDGDQGAALWQVQSSDTGEQYIVALYEEDDEQVKTASSHTSSIWDVTLSKVAGELQVSYKNDPILKIASSKLGIPLNEVEKVPSYLPAKLAENKKLVSALLSQLSSTARIEVLRKYPELI